MPGQKLADAYVPITGDNSPLRRTLHQTRGILNDWFRDIRQGIGQGIGQAIFGSITQGISKGIGLIRSSLKATSDLNESLSKTAVAFGSSAQAILTWSETSAQALGQSRQQALEAASTFGLLFSSMGLASEEAAGMSMTLVQLATDMASINNIGIDEALIKLRAGLVGETEPLRTVGVLLNAVAVEQEALRTGLAATTDEITEQDKVMARYQLILDQTIKTQGDYQRTLSGIANQERFLAAQREDALAQIGAAFSPIYLVVLRNINKLLGQIAPYGENIVRSLATGMVKGIIHILPALRFIKDVITLWLKPGSPPRLLPDLAKWGAGAMQSYLDGWASADFGVLQNLGSSIEGILRSFVASGAIKENEIVERVFGTRKAILAAVNQWRQAGHITEETIQAISAAAGPAGFNIGGLVRAYFDLEGASRRAAAAQEELRDVTERYDRLLQPLNDQLDEINDKQQEIRDKQSISAARKVIRDPAATANEKRLAQLEIEAIGVRKQIDNVEEERDVALRAAEQKLQAAQREERTAQAILLAQQALYDQQVKTNELIREENDLRKAQEQEAERLYQATLAYNMAIADTEGKLSLMRLELARTEQGSVEYYNILTQIAGLEEQLEKEREARDDTLVKPEDVLPNLSDLDIPQWASELADELDKAFKDILGIGQPVIDPNLLMQQGVPRQVIDQLIEENQPSEIGQGAKDFVDTLKVLADGLGNVSVAVADLNMMLGELKPAFLLLGEILSILFGVNEDAVESTTEATGEIESNWTRVMNFLVEFVGKMWALLVYIGTTAAESMTHLVKAMLAVFRGDWEAAWEHIKTVGILKWTLFKNVIESLLGETFQPVIDWAQWVQDSIAAWDLGEAGRAFVQSLWTGMSSFWTETVQPWWEEKTQWIADLLPGSEPRNPNSPLAGLAKRGKAIVENLQLGIDSSELKLPAPDFSSLASAGAGATDNSRSVTANNWTVTVTGGGEVEDMAEKIKEALLGVLVEVGNA